LNYNINKKDKYNYAKCIIINKEFNENNGSYIYVKISKISYKLLDQYMDEIKFMVTSKMKLGWKPTGPLTYHKIYSGTYIQMMTLDMSECNNYDIYNIQDKNKLINYTY
jgi:hypothetical protein